MSRRHQHTIARQEAADRAYHVRWALLERLTPERRARLDTLAPDGDSTYWERCPLSDLLACLQRMHGAAAASDPAKDRADLFGP